MEDIRIGNTGYLNDFLNAVIAEEVEEDIADIFDIEPEMLKGDVFNPDVISLIKKLIDIDEKKS